MKTGRQDTIAEIAGASGPILNDGYGNLYYATGSSAYPPPKGKTDIIRFSSSQVVKAFGPGKLGFKDAAPIIKGLDAGSAMA